MIIVATVGIGSIVATVETDVMFGTLYNSGN
jgi:hypothetical protein